MTQQGGYCPSAVTIRTESTTEAQILNFVSAIDQLYSYTNESEYCTDRLR